MLSGSVLAIIAWTRRNADAFGIEGLPTSASEAVNDKSLRTCAITFHCSDLSLDLI
jgi:hypothetical protein